jgi:hypothetical protein
MADFNWDTNNILTGTLEEKAYKLATAALNVAGAKYPPPYN